MSHQIPTKYSLTTFFTPPSLSLAPVDTYSLRFATCSSFPAMECLVGFDNVVVDFCPSDYQPNANKAVMAFTTRHTFYLQSLLVYFNAAVGE